MMRNNQYGSVCDSKVTPLSRFRSSVRRGRGATTTELIILLILIALVSLGIFRVFGNTIKSKLTGAQTTVAAVGHDDKSGTTGDFEQTSSAGGAQASKSADRGVKSGSVSAGGSVANTGSGAAAAPTSVAKVEQKPGSVGGFNPWILAIFLGLGGLLIYVFFAKKSN